MTTEASEPRIGLLASEEPPQGRTGATQAVLALLPYLKEQSSTWFRVAEFPNPTGARNCADYLRTVKLPVHGTFEFRTRKVEGGSVLWARHVIPNQGVLRSVS